MADNPTQGKSSTWPNGEPKSVRDAERGKSARDAYEAGKRK